MGENSKIEWCDHTFNPWRGCTQVAAGCEHCYAETFSQRNPGVLGKWGPNGTRVMASAAHWKLPLKWNREAEKSGVRAKVFCASFADVFEDWPGPVVDSRGNQLAFQEEGGDGWSTIALGGYRMPISVASTERPATLEDVRRDLFALVDATPWLDWILLTKRPENVRRMWRWRKQADPNCQECAGCGCVDTDGSYIKCPFCLEHRKNIWLVTSVATQADADRNVPLLLACRDLVPVLGVSAEPLLGPLALSSWLSALDWVICGGESGPAARPMHPDWARSLRDQCQAAGVPFFFKQWGEWAEGDCVPGGDLGGDVRNGKAAFVHASPRTDEELCLRTIWPRTKLMRRVGKKNAGRLLGGREWNEFPRGAETGSSALCAATAKRNP